MAGYKEGTENKFDDVTSNELVFVFDNPEMALAFKTWLCNCGEQSMGDYIDEHNSQRGKPDALNIDFDYWSEGNRIDGRSDPEPEKADK